MIQATLKNNITFVLGGARSGKSTYALRCAKAFGNNIAYVATAGALDDEMKKRISLHKRHRPGTWKTFEEQIHVADVIQGFDRRTDGIIIDCITMLVSNMLLRGMKEKKIMQEIDRICRHLTQGKASAVIVSNEVGFGIVPDNKLARDFRDIAGRVNQRIAQYADNVHLICAGIPIKLK